MNFTETFQEFSSRLSTVDVMLYAGVALVVWVLFKDKLSPLTRVVGDLLNRGKKVLPGVPRVAKHETDVFFDLVTSWKRTRDLAEQAGCKEAVEAADKMFPYLNPVVCEENNNVATK